jgi:ActR/RegA family two-component response regulator
MLIIDDDRRYAESLCRDAQRKGIRLQHASSLEEGRELFEGPVGAVLTGIILDVKCLRDKRQTVPDNSFIVAAVRYFGEKAPHLPMAAITGESSILSSMAELFAGTIHVYSKGRDEAEMLSYLRGKARQLDQVRLRAEHAEEFAICSRHLGREAEDELYSVLCALGTRDYTDIKNALGCLRRLQEKLYIAINRMDPSLVPTQMVAGEVNVVAAYKHLAEKGVVERYRIIDRFAELVYKIASDSGAHTPYDNPRYPPTGHTLAAVVHAFLDLLLWFGGLAEEGETVRRAANRSGCRG